MSNENLNDPMEFMKNMWGNMGFALPGMVAPTVDTDELGKRITDLKAVEGWLRSNLSLLQMTIQGLEMQRNTLAALQQMSQAAQGPGAGSGIGSGEPTANPFLNPANWQMPWNMMGGAVPPASAAAGATTQTVSAAEQAAQPKG